MTDPWSTWTDDAAARLAEEARLNERQREAVAEFLAPRGQHQAAATVAISEFRSVEVDGWDGRQYETYISVPAPQYDLASEEIHERIDSAASAVIGKSHYRSLNVEVALGNAPERLARDLLRRLNDRQAEQHPPPLAPHAAASG
jgi:hypothetical protein